MRGTILVAAAVLLAVAGCGGDDEGGTTLGRPVTSAPGPGTPPDASTTTGPTTTGPGGTGPAATGPGGTGPAATGPGGTGPGATGPAATGPGGTGTAGTAPPTAPESTPVVTRCRTSELGLSFSSLAPAAGGRSGFVVLRNTAGRTCTVYGFGGLQPLDSARRALPVRLERGGPAPTLLRLAPGQAVGKRVRFAGTPAGVTCVSPASVRVTPPDETDPLVTRWPWGPVCGGRIVGQAYGTATGT